MKKKQKYKIVLVITLLLFSFSIGLSFLNYSKDLDETQNQLIQRSLPLSIDNIYTEIQRNIIEPNLVSSMMANNTFLKDWLINEEENVEKISKYLDTIKNKYNMFNTFLVSQQTKNYYTPNGFLEKIDKKNESDSWYFDFLDESKNHEINLDFNEHLDNNLIMFINYKIYDEDYHNIGVTGIAIKTSYVNNMLKKFRINYNFDVFFIDKKGEVKLSETGIDKFSNIKEVPEIYALKDKIYELTPKIIEYNKDNKRYIMNIKYIQELDLYLIVEAEVDKFLLEVKKTFYLNLFISIIVTLIIIVIILYTIRDYNNKLEKLASFDSLTKLQNRRTFDLIFDKTLKQFRRDAIPRGVIFFDIDNFKNINDTYGHLVGDKVLVRVANILNSSIRSSDYSARWGGEEFFVLLNDSNQDNTLIIAQNLREKFENDMILREYVQNGVTSSFGITQFQKNDTIDKIIARVDKALYKAKDNGKNQVVKA